MDGFKLFLRYAEGCRCYLEDKGLISREDSEIVKSGRADLETLRRVFYVALPGLENLAKRLGKDRFDPDILRQYYAFEHNEKKFREGNLICLAFPARVLEAEGRKYLLELEPVSGRFRVSSDWVMFHRINLVEKIPEGFAGRVSEFLQKLGMGKSYKFPRVGIRYLERLRDARG
jgi:hypothetical protein